MSMLLFGLAMFGIYMAIGFVIVAIAIMVYSAITIWIERDSLASRIIDVFMFALLWPVVVYMMLRDAIQFVHEWMKGGDDE